MQNQEMVRTVNKADAKEKFIAYGVETVGTSIDEYVSVIKAGIARMSKLIGDAGIRGD